MYMNVSDLMLSIEMFSAHGLDIHHDGVFPVALGPRYLRVVDSTVKATGTFPSSTVLVLVPSSSSDGKIPPCCHVFPENSYTQNSHEIANSLNCGIGHIVICNYLSTIFSATMSTMP